MRHLARAALSTASATALVAITLAPAAATTGPQTPAGGARQATARSSARVPAAPQADFGHSYDNRVIFQSFSVYQPYDKNMYARLAGQGDQLKQWGVTDVWMPPAYRSFDMARYMEGYAIADRYDLGEFPKGRNEERATKYGTSDELKSLVDQMHGKGLRVQMDLVPNQMIGLAGREPVVTTRVNRNGRTPYTKEFTDHQTTTWQNELMLAYTKGGGEGQQKYGLFKEWNKNHFNGTSTQNLGRGDLLRDPSGKPYKVSGPDLNLPDWAWNGTPFDLGKGHNQVEGYLSARDAYEVGNGNWRPYLINYPGFVAYAKSSCGFESDDAVKFGVSPTMSIWDCKDRYLSVTPEYNGRSEDRSYANLPEGIEFDDQVSFAGHSALGSAIDWEFLVGNDIDNSRDDVIDEQKNWMRFLLNTYKFDGFRVDAASHVNPRVLDASAQVVNEHFRGDRSKFTSYLESYAPWAMAPIVDRTNNTQLVMDVEQREVAEEAMRPNAPRPLADAYKWSAAGSRIDTPEIQARPNWSFVMNHDKQTIQINKTMQAAMGIRPNVQQGDQKTARSFADEYTKEGEAKALQAWFDDLSKVDKQWTETNIPARYAMMLTNAKTLPTVWYGDLYRTDAPYMSVKTPYFGTIDALLKARQQYADGPQRIDQFATNGKPAGDDLVASVRMSGDRAKGMATVVSDNPAVDSWVTINMGPAHANQAYRDVTGKNPGTAITDGQGQLFLHVTGQQTAEVKGHLGVWAPVDTAEQWAVHGAIRTKWLQTPELGQPVGGEHCYKRDGGCFQDFQNGSIYWSPATDAHFVRGEIFKKWGQYGWETGFLGYPTTDEFCGLRDEGCGQHFQGGSIYWSRASGAHLVRGAIRDQYAGQGWELGKLGYPINDEYCGLRDGGCISQFQHGLIYWSPASGSGIVLGAIESAYEAQRWETGPLGYPRGNEFCGLRDAGCAQHFQGGMIYWSRGTGPQVVRGAILDAYATQRWETGRLGYPTSWERCDAGGCVQDFQGGRITWNPRDWTRILYR